jgi:hypothetical protein
MKKKIVLSAVLVFLTLFSASSAFAATVSNRAVFYVGQQSYTVEGSSYSMPAVTLNREGRVFVPVRYLALALGVPEDKIVWSPSARTVTLFRGGVDVVLAEGGSVIYVGGRAMKIDVAPFIYKDRIYLPARYLAEAFGFEVGWDDRLRAVIIRVPGTAPQKPVSTELQATVEALKKFLAEQKGLPVAGISLKKAEAVNWPDTSLGRPEPGKMYAQVITPGYLIVLSYGQTDFEFHTDKGGNFVLVKVSTDIGAFRYRQI